MLICFEGGGGRVKRDELFTKHGTTSTNQGLTLTRIVQKSTINIVVELPILIATREGVWGNIPAIYLQ